MEQKEYWDSVADEKTFTTPFQKNLFVEYVSKNERVLDVGCGYGRTLEELHQLGYEALTGLDFSEGMIRRGKNLYSGFPAARAALGILGDRGRISSPEGNL